jgi:hypothetical protein
MKKSRQQKTNFYLTNILLVPSSFSPSLRNIQFDVLIPRSFSPTTQFTCEEKIEIT